MPSACPWKRSRRRSRASRPATGYDEKLSRKAHLFPGEQGATANIVSVKPESWIKPVPGGLYCEPADLFIDPTRKVARAVITHGHSDHARPGHQRVLATRETLALMEARYGDEAGAERQALAYGETLRLGEVSLKLVPAGHVLGSAQVVLEYRGSRLAVSRDYKRRR